MARLPSRGRQKLPLRKIEKASSRDVTFSKRRSGLFKKIADLSVLTGAELAVVAFSPAGRPFSFGNPNVDHVLARFEHGGGPLVGGGGPPANDGALAAALAQLRYTQELLEAEKRRGAELKQGRGEEQDPSLMGLPELYRLRGIWMHWMKVVVEMAERQRTGGAGAGYSAAGPSGAAAVGAWAGYSAAGPSTLAAGGAWGAPPAAGLPSSTTGGAWGAPPAAGPPSSAIGGAWGDPFAAGPSTSAPGGAWGDPLAAGPPPSATGGAPGDPSAAGPSSSAAMHFSSGDGGFGFGPSGGPI